MTRIDVQAVGFERIFHKYTKAAARTTNFEPALLLIAFELQRIYRSTFSGQGRRGGGSWHALSEHYARRKAKLGPDPRILHAHRTLKRSMVEFTHEYAVREIKPHELTFGSSLEYAAIHQHGGRGIPARPYMDVLDSDREKFSRIILEHVGGDIGRRTIR